MQSFLIPLSFALDDHVIWNRSPVHSMLAKASLPAINFGRWGCGASIINVAGVHQLTALNDIVVMGTGTTRCKCPALSMIV